MSTLKKKKILVIRFSSIGDIVLTSPVIRCIKQQLPEYELHFLTKRSFKKLVENNIHIDRFHYLKNSLLHTIQELQLEKFDYVIDLHHNLRTFFIKLALRNAKIFSFPKMNIEKWLLVNLKKNKLPDVHIVDRYFETVQSLNITNDGAGLDYFIGEEDEVNINELPESHRDGFVAMVIGAKFKTKRLPLSKLVEIAKRLKLPIVVLGGKEDKTKAYKMVNAVGGGKVYNCCGIYNINQSASLIKQANSVLTNDTGLMHIAAAFQKDIVSVWGNTVPEFGMTPYFGNKNPSTPKSQIFEVEGLSCRPCSKIGYHRCPKGHFHCMELLNVNQIADEINVQSQRLRVM